MSQTHSYEAEAHVAQMSILRKLLIGQTASFSDLSRATSLTTDHTNFHIKQLISAKMVEHIPKAYGQYRLTRRGKEYANRMDTEELVIEKQPKLVVEICIEKDGKFLFQERRKQPYYGYWSFPTGKIRWGETIIQAAARELMEETGLTATLRKVGTHHKLDYDNNGQLLEDKYLILVHGVSPKGTMVVETETHINHWLTPDEYRQQKVNFGEIDEILESINDAPAFISEAEYHYQAEDY